jgi:hypothetical protein
LLYGKEWLEKPVGFSNLQPNDEKGVKKWAVYVGSAIREKSGADIAIHAPPMNGDNYPVGIINRRSLFNSFPRILDINEIYGWNIYTSKVRGVMAQADDRGHEPVWTTTGDFGGRYKIYPHAFWTENYQDAVNGEKVNPFKLYTVAVTEGVVKGAQGVDKRP